VVASQVIVWRLATGWARIYMIVLNVVLALVAVALIVIQDYFMGLLAILSLFIITVGPALRWRKGFRSVMLTLNEDGLRSDISENAGIYKWTSIRPAQVIANRCFIPVSSATALVFPVNVTSPDNLNALIAAIGLRSQADQV
jgi:hypothetical protein